MLAARCSMLALLALLSVIAVRANIQNVTLADSIAYGATARHTSQITFSEAGASKMVATCRSDIFVPGMRLHLLRFNQRSFSLDYDSWYQAAGSAEEYLVSAIRCAPSRGDSWIRSALVSQSIAEDPKRLIAMVQYASWLNPAERSQLLARMTLWSRVTEETQALGRPLIARDIDLLLRYGDEPMVIPALRSTIPTIQELVQTTLQSLPPDRRASVEAMNAKRTRGGWN
jgi:hypothetical protein